MIPREPEENENIEPEDESGETESPASLEEELAAERQKAAEYLANWQRAQADFINYKRRIEQERADFNKFANANLILSLLPILDDLGRALGVVPSAKSAKHSWLEGIKLIDNKLRATIQAQGLTPIEALGEPFDPNYHEAIRQDKGKDGIVIEEFQKGYMLGDRVLRPA